MNANVQAVVEACSRGSEKDWLNFGQVLEKLAGVGVEGYYADFRRSAKTYYLPDGKNIEVKANDPDVAIASAFEAGTHTYRAFCEKVMAAGCAGYLVSLLGRRVVYFGRTAETHVEHFPNK